MRIFCCYESSSFRVTWWHQFRPEGVQLLPCVCLDLKGEVTDVTCALQLQLHLIKYKSNKSLESSVDSRESHPRLKQSFKFQQIQRGKVQMQNLADPRLRHSRLTPVLIGTCQALSVGQEYLGSNTGSSKKHQDFLWKTTGDCP